MENSFPFSHRWSIVNLDWLCENVNGHQKLETKIPYGNGDSLSNEPNKWLTVEIWPNGFDEESSKHISLRIWAGEYIFFRLWVNGNNSSENMLKVENSNKLSRDIKIKTYLRKTELLGNSLLENGKSFSISIEGVIVKTKNFNVLKFLNQLNQKIGNATVTYDKFDLINSIHSIRILNWTIKNFQIQMKNGTKRFEHIVQFATNITFGLVLEESKDSWKIFIQLKSTDSPKLFMWFRMKQFDEQEKDSSSPVIKNIQQVKVFEKIDEIMEFKWINMKKLLGNKKKYFLDENLVLSFEMIRFNDFSNQFNQVQQKAKLENFVMERFIIFNCISSDSLKFFLENNSLNQEVSREDLVKIFLKDEETQKNVFDTFKDVITDLTQKVEENGSTYNINLHNVFLNKNGNSTFGNVSINESAISEKTLDHVENFFTKSLKELQKEINLLQNTVEKTYEIESTEFTVNQNGVEVTVKIENFKKMIRFFIKILLPFITDTKLMDKLLDDEWWKAEDENSMTFNGNVAKAKSNKETSSNFNGNQNVSNAKQNLNNEITDMFKNFQSISTFRLPINNLEIVYYWAAMFAYGDLIQMQSEFPLPQFQSISNHAEYLIESYKKQNKILKNSCSQLIVDLAGLIKKQVNELTNKKKEPTRYITVEFLNSLDKN